MTEPGEFAPSKRQRVDIWGSVQSTCTDEETVTISTTQRKRHNSGHICHHMNNSAFIGCVYISSRDESDSDIMRTTRVL